MGMPKKTRVFFRVKTDFPVRLRREAGGDSLQAKAVDLSVGGLALEMNKSLAPGELVVLQFRLPFQFKKVSMEAEVVRCVVQEEGGKSSYLAALQFTRMDPFVTHRVSSFVVEQIGKHSFRMGMLALCVSVLIMIVARPLGLC